MKIEKNNSGEVVKDLSLPKVEEQKVEQKEEASE